MNRPLVSIVCVSHDRRELLLQCLKSCRSQDYPNREIVVLLNPGDPEVEAAIHATMPEVRVARTHRNIGFFPGLNLAIANANGEFILTVDDDAYFLTDDVVSQMVNAFAGETELGAVTCNIEGPRETTFSGDDRYVHVFKTGFTMVPKLAFTDWVGFYPDLFFRSAGETFLSTGLWEKGKRVKCLIRARMFHETAIQGRSDLDWKFYGLRSQALCVVMREPWFMLPLSLASKFVKSLVNFVRWGHFVTWVRAWWSVLIHLSEGFHLRHPVSWRTYRLLHRLQNNVVTRLELHDWKRRT
jgi:GT2 family glycosyltransferase